MYEMQSSDGQQVREPPAALTLELARSAAGKVSFGTLQRINSKAPFSKGPIAAEAHPPKSSMLQKYNRKLSLMAAAPTRPLTPIKS